MCVPHRNCPGYSLEAEERRESGEDKREFEEFLKRCSQAIRVSYDSVRGARGQVTAKKQGKVQIRLSVYRPGRPPSRNNRDGSILLAQVRLGFYGKKVPLLFLSTRTK